MPIKVSQPAAEDNAYASPFRGPVNHTAQIACNIANLTSAEVDAKGWLKPGLPLTAAGALVGAPAASQAYVGTGNGTMTGLTADANADDDVYEITLILAAANGGTFRVVSGKRGVLPNAVVGTPYDNEINFTINDGATDFIVGDKFTVVVASAAVFGVTIEPIQVANGNAAGDLSGAGTQQIAVAVIGMVNLKVCEDNLGRVLTAAEKAGFNEPGCRLTLLQ